MKNKRFLKNILSSVCSVLVVTIIIMILNVAMEGMWLFGIPNSENVTSVTIKYPSITEEQLEITDREQIDTCVQLSGLLKYKPFVDGDAEDSQLITFYYHLTNGDQVEVSANSIAVFYKGKRHILKDGNLFVKCVEALFYQEYLTE